MFVKEADLKPNARVSMDVTRQRFAVLSTPRDARWRAVPAKVRVINRAEALRLQERAR